VLGADIARQCLEHGLLDEVIVVLAPALLGDGVRLVQSPGGRWVQLEPIEVLPSDRLTDMRFRVVK
jgi:riboflavin biosynthesis pyrimidine reductase